MCERAVHTGHASCVSPQGMVCQHGWHLMQEGLENVAGLGHGNHAGGTGVVDAVMEVIDAARIHDLLPRYVRARQHAHGCAKLRHGPVPTRASLRLMHQHQVCKLQDASEYALQ